MLGDTITLTYNSVAKILSKINQDSYSAVYQLRSATEEFRLNVRHINESAKAGVVPFERHSFDLTHTVFATTTTVETIDIASWAVRCKRGSDPAISLLAAKAQVAWLSDANITKLIAWES